MTALRLERTWDKASHDAVDEVDSTFCRLAIFISERNVTEHRDAGGRRLPTLHVPAYYLAEWLAENWWPLLL